MARKSRKNLPQPEQAMVSVQFPELDEEKIPTAIYGRLSVEDDEDNESMETQIALVQDFINRSGELNYVDTYFDNRSQNFLFSPLAEMASEAKMWPSRSHFKEQVTCWVTEKLSDIHEYVGGLTPDFLDVLEEGFKEFFEKEVSNNPLKAEYFQEV